VFNSCELEQPAHEQIISDYQTGALEHIAPEDGAAGPATRPAGLSASPEGKEGGQGKDRKRFNPVNGVAGVARAVGGLVGPHRTAPNPAMPGNVLIHAFPEPPTETLKPILDNMDRVMVRVDCLHL